VARVSWSHAEGTTLLHACWAASPAHWADSYCSIFTWWVAEGAAHLEAGSACERSTCSSAVGLLGAGDADISLSILAIWGADAAADVVEASSALGIVQESPLLPS